MADLLGDEWCAGVLDAAKSLPEIDGVAFSFDIEVSESAAGKVRANGWIEQGRLASLEAGKYVPAQKGDKADVSFIGKAKRVLPIIEGERAILVAYMLGELKIDGAYELVVDHLANQVDRGALEDFRAAVAAFTD